MQTEQSPADVADWAVLGFSKAAVDFIDSILRAQNAHRHWKAGGFAVANITASNVMLPRIEAGKRLKAVEDGTSVEVSE